jgi:DNA modification methylase
MQPPEIGIPPATETSTSRALPGPHPGYRPEQTTVWSFPNRGTWATHQGDYRGNWSPYVPRNLIERYTKRDDVVLDPMVGSGTTLVEAKLLGRRSIGVDCNPDAINLCHQRVRIPGFDGDPTHEPCILLGDARNLEPLQTESVDLVALHPPYGSIIRYSDGKIPADLSSVESIPEFLDEMRQVAKEVHRVLRKGKHCAVLMADIRQNGHIVPLSFRTMEQFLAAGFLIREHVVKLQWNVQSERLEDRDRITSYYRIAHEHLFVFRRPADRQDVQRHCLSANAT